MLRVVGLLRTVAIDGEGPLREPRASVEKALGARGVARRRASGVWPLRRRPSGARVPAAPRRRASGVRFLTAEAVQCAGPRRLPGEGAWVRGRIAAKGLGCATLRPRGVDARPKCSQGRRMSDVRFFSRIGKGSTSISRAFGRLRRAAAHRGPLAATLPQPAATRRPSGAARRDSAAARRNPPPVGGCPPRRRPARRGLLQGDGRPAPPRAPRPPERVLCSRRAGGGAFCGARAGAAAKPAPAPPSVRRPAQPPRASVRCGR